MGCAATHNKPSTAGASAQRTAVGVRGDVVTTQNAVKNAQVSTTKAGQLSDSMAGNLDQAERKQVLIRRWFELDNKFWLLPPQ